MGLSLAGETGGGDGDDFGPLVVRMVLSLRISVPRMGVTSEPRMGVTPE